MKINCSTCFDPIEIDADTASAIKCPTCNNLVEIPDSDRKSDSGGAVAPPKGAVEKGLSTSAVKAEVAESASKKTKSGRAFSYRMAACSLFLSLFILVSVLFCGAAFYFFDRTIEGDTLLRLREEFFKFLQIGDSSEYTKETLITTIIFTLVPALFALFALIAVCSYKRITAIVLLTILVLMGFAAGTPYVAILCLILVCVPGRADAWEKGA